MKTAEEWFNSIDFCGTDEEVKFELKQIQLDAWKQGMEDAIEIMKDGNNNILERIERLIVTRT